MTKIHISLLPAEMRRQSSIMKIWTVIAMILAIIAMILLAGNILLSLYIQQPVNELESLKTEQQNITENIGRLSYIQEMFDEIEAIDTDIENLRGVDPDWSYVIDMISSNAGLYGIKVNRMEIMAGGQSTGGIMTCWTEDVENINAWSDNLEEIDGIGYVEISNIITNLMSDNKLEFQFSATIGINKWNEE